MIHGALCAWVAGSNTHSVGMFCFGCGPHLPAALATPGSHQFSAYEHVLFTRVFCAVGCLGPGASFLDSLNMIVRASGDSPVASWPAAPRAEGGGGSVLRAGWAAVGVPVLYCASVYAFSIGAPSIIAAERWDPGSQWAYLLDKLYISVNLSNPEHQLI